MKKIISVLCALALITCSMPNVRTFADAESSTEYLVNNRYTLEESHAVTEDNLVYFSLKTCRDGGFVNQEEKGGTYEISPLLEKVMELYPDAKFSVRIDRLYSNEERQKLTDAYQQEHTIEGKTYAEFMAEAEAIRESVGEQAFEDDYQEMSIQRRFVLQETRKYVNDIISEELSEEENRLEANGFEMLEAHPGQYKTQAYVTAEQLKNFPANPHFCYQIALAPVLMYDPVEEAKHTFYQGVADLRDYEGKYGIMNNTAYSTYITYDGRLIDDFIEDAYEPNAGTFDCSALVNGIMEELPEVKIGVVIQMYPDVEHSEAFQEEREQFLNSHEMDGQTYAQIMETFYEADRNRTPISKELGNQVQQIVQEQSQYFNVLREELAQAEPDRLKENGIEVRNVINGKIYAEVTPEQLKDFPVHSAIGYFICLGVAPGDVMTDGNVDILDVVVLNKACLGKETLSEAQCSSADVNKNGAPDAGDSLEVLKYIVGVNDTL